MKTFNLRCYINSESLKTLIDGENIFISMVIDAQVKCSLRINACVDEDKNEMNAPVMFYTPQKEGFVHSFKLDQ